MAATRTGSIILDHDGGGDRSQTVAALKVVLPQLLAAGYRFTSV
jgi:peptidoglycan/xylan/chitin deacetylase (PgdA/CDA1 family)